MTPREFLRKILPFVVIRPDPEHALVSIRLRELAAMGLEDVPRHEGVSSSVRQYAINSLMFERDHPDNSPIMLTSDSALLKLADRLAERYGLRPVSIEEGLKRLRISASRDRGPDSTSAY